MSRSTVTVTIYPRVPQLVKAMARVARVLLTAERQTKRFRRQVVIKTKQFRRDQHRANRRPVLIHNGRRAL